jgi:hypothetical protein
VPARSVSELLPRPFADLTLDDVGAIVAAVGEERESLFFERKEKVSTAALAKSCAAFANTYGGLLLVGIDDATDKLTGVEPIAEPQVWVKDVLRGHLLPLPPFQARSLALRGKRALLLVLVEESTSTPHLITRQGAIYVRNPGSSDPVPIQDQGRLLELVARGERARGAAWRNAARVLGEHHFEKTVRPLILALAATGVSSRFVSPLFDRGADLQLLRSALGEHEDTTRDLRRSFWAQHSAGVARYRRPDLYPVYPDRIEGIEVWRYGAVAILRGRIPRPDRDDEEHDELSSQALAEDIRRSLDVGLDVLLELGAHGDAALAFSLPAGRRVQWPSRIVDVENGVGVFSWIQFDLGDDARDEVARNVVAEVRRALGLGPEALGD